MFGVVLSPIHFQQCISEIGYCTFKTTVNIFLFLTFEITFPEY